MSSSPSLGDGDKNPPSVAENQVHAPGKDHRGRVIDFLRVEEGEVYTAHSRKRPKWYQRLLDAGAEENGIKPVPAEQRTNTEYNNLFTVFFTSLFCLLPYVFPRP